MPGNPAPSGSKSDPFMYGTVTYMYGPYVASVGDYLTDLFPKIASQKFEVV